MSALKRRVSDPAHCSSILWESSDLKGKLSKEAKRCLAHDFGWEKMDLYAKENDVCPHDVEAIRQICLEDQRSSPPIEGTFSTELAEISKTAHTYFTDLPSPDSDEEASDDMVSKSTRYFSTPMVSKPQQKKRLTPVMEVEMESSGHLTYDETCKQDVLQNEIANSNAAASDSPKEPPLYRSFFASECQEIVSQLEGIKAERNISGKRKLDELDVSSIDAEPPPYNTLMKSMLACEVANTPSSLESSPNKGGESMFLESFLDLEKVDLQLHHFSLTEDLKYVHKGDTWKGCTTDGLSLLGDLDDEVCSKKRQKLEQLCDEDKHLSLESPKRNSEVLNQTPESPVHKRDTDSEEERMTVSDEFIIKQGLATINLTLELERSKNAFSEESICNSSNVAKLHRFSKEAESSNVKVNTLGNTTKDLVFVHEQLSADFEKDTTDPKQSENILQSTVIIDHYNDDANITQVIECTSGPSDTLQDMLQSQLVTVARSIQTVPESANKTQDIVEIQSVANTTLELVSASATHADVVVHGDVNKVEPITVMRTTVRLSPNTTHEIVSVHDEVTAANSTHVIEAMHSNSADATQEIIPVRFELLAANTSQVIEAVPIASVNITQDFALTPAENSVSSVTQDIMRMDDEVIAANTCPENIVPEIDAESPKDNKGAFSVLKSANTTQVIDDMENPSQSSVQDGALMCGDNCAVSPTQDIVLAHEGNSATSTTEYIALTHEGNSFRTIQNVALAHDGNCDADSAQDVSSPVVLKDTILKEIRQMPQDKISFTEKVHVNPMHVTEPVPVTLATDIINISCATGSSIDHTIEVPPDHSHTRSPTHSTAEDVLPTSTLTQSKQEISQSVSDKLPVEDEKLKYLEVTCNKKCDIDGTSGVLRDPSSKESMGEPGPCDPMQEAENIHDESVFSVSSLSFVTSTPVPGLNNFHFKNLCKDLMLHDANLSLCSVVEEPTEKAAVQQKPSTQQSFLETQSTIGNPQVKKIPRGTLLYRATQRNFLFWQEASKLQQPSSTIPSALSSLALNAGTASQKICKELVLLQNPPKLPGIPTRGVMRPPLSRNSILKTSMGNLKQGIRGTSGNILQSKLSGSHLKTPKVTPKAKGTSSNALSLPGSLIRPPSRLSVAGSGPLSAGSQSSNTAVQQTAGGITGSTMQPSAPTASRAPGFVRPRPSFLRPPIPVQLPRSPPKTKSNLPGPPVQKFQRELPKAAPASTRNESGTTKVENCSAARAPKTNLTVSPKPCSQLVAFETAGAKTNIVQAEKLVAEATSKTQSTSDLQGKTTTLPTASAGDMTVPVSENCSHLKACACCNKKYQQLLQELQELKSCLEKVQHPAAIAPPTSCLEVSEESKQL